MTAIRREAMDLTDMRLLLNRLGAAARSDGASPRSFALLLGKAFEERAWEYEGFPSFRAYMSAPEPAGLEMTEGKLMDAARLADVEALARRLLMEEVPAALPAGGDRRSDDFQSNGLNLKPGPTAERTVARLKRTDPGLAEKVVRGEVTPNAAAREKGWRKPRIVLSTPERIADSLRRWMPREALARLIDLLSEPENTGDG